MYSFWLTSLSSNKLNSKLNLWFIDNIRLFNILSSSMLSYLIYSINSPRLNYIKTFRQTLNFDYVLYYFWLILLLLLLSTYLISV